LEGGVTSTPSDEIPAQLVKDLQVLSEIGQIRNAWLPGMLALGRRRNPGAWFRLQESVPKLSREWSDAIPVLSDPATVGCLLVLTRESLGDPGAYVEATYDERTGTSWWRCRSTVPCPHCGTEGEALAAAIHMARSSRR
jgi:hypothetical protein